MKRKTVMISAAVLFSVIILLLWSASGRKVQTVQAETRPRVLSEQPQTGNIILYTELTGAIESKQKASVLPKQGGEVVEVYFKAGDQVEEGQILCKIDSDALTQLKINMDSAEITLSDRKNTLSRTRALYDVGAVSSQEMEQAENGEKSARLAYESAKNQYDLQVEYINVKAPISGVAESRNVDVHDYIGTGTEICLISGDDQKQVKFGITEKTFKNLTIEDEILAEANGVAYEGTVTEISSTVNPSTGLYEAKASLLNSDALTTGTRVKLTVMTDRAQNVMTIPLEAVNYDNGVAFVYCYEDGTARKTEIKAGIYDSEKIEVKSGLTCQNNVIVSWSNELVDGAEVLLEKSTDYEKTVQAGIPAVVQRKAGE